MYFFVSHFTGNLPVVGGQLMSVMYNVKNCGHVIIAHQSGSILYYIFPSMAASTL